MLAKILLRDLPTDHIPTLVNWFQDMSVLMRIVGSAIINGDMSEATLLSQIFGNAVIECHPESAEQDLFIEDIEWTEQNLTQLRATLKLNGHSFSRDTKEIEDIIQNLEATAVTNLAARIGAGTS
jgi:hypothetical protein